MNNNFTKKDLVNDLIQLGLKVGDLVNVKVSMRSIGKVDGGAKTLIEAILEVIGESGTIVVDSFLPVYPIKKLKKNKSLVSNNHTKSYAGAFANEVIKHPDCYRSNHPVQKFSAIGLLAEKLLKRHTSDSYAYNVFKEMSELGGVNLKIGTDEKVPGVGTTHVAIGMLGLKQKRLNRGINYYQDESNLKQFVRNWAGGCAKGFNNFLDDYRASGAIISDGFIGNAPSKISDMKKTLQIEYEILKRNPKYMFCDDRKCVNCKLTWDFHRESVLNYLLKNHFHLSPIEIFNALKIVIAGKFQPTEIPKELLDEKQDQ